eukprot:s106_g12.t1
MSHQSSWWSTSSSWEQREPQWNRAEAEGEQSWERSWTPAKRTFKYEQQDWQSPTGYKHTPSLPDNFVQSKSHLGSREVYGKTLLRKIAATSWSSKYGLAGQSMEQVKLVDLLWCGWHNQHLRALSRGSYVSLLVAGKMNEAVFLQALLSQRSLKNRFVDCLFMAEIMQSHMVTSFVSVSHGKHIFGDINVYEQLPMQPSQAEVFLRSATSRPFLRRYKWGVNLRTYSLPIGPIAYILLKQKKDFKAARPIISYVHFLYAKLFRAAAIALDLILRSVCPRSFGLDTLPSILQKLTVFLQQLPDDADPVVCNQDLVGFFTSIPVFRILNAVRWAVTEYCLIKNVDLESTSFSVNLQEQDTKLRIWKGRPRKAAKHTVLIHLSDIVDICELSCDASVFTVMHKVFRQCRGATIGNQISPMLAGLTVSIEEEIYVRHLQSFFHDNMEIFFCTRYVGNRLVVVSRQLLQDRRLQHFLTNNFYQAR